MTLLGWLTRRAGQVVQMHAVGARHVALLLLTMPWATPTGQRRQAGLRLITAPTREDVATQQSSPETTLAVQGCSCLAGAGTPALEVH